MMQNGQSWASRAAAPDRSDLKPQGGTKIARAEYWPCRGGDGGEMHISRRKFSVLSAAALAFRAQRANAGERMCLFSDRTWSGPSGSFLEAFASSEAARAKLSSQRTRRRRKGDSNCWSHLPTESPFQILFCRPELHRLKADPFRPEGSGRRVEFHFPPPRLCCEPGFRRFVEGPRRLLQEIEQPTARHRVDPPTPLGVRSPQCGSRSRSPGSGTSVGSSPPGQHRIP